MRSLVDLQDPEDLPRIEALLKHGANTSIPMYEDKDRNGELADKTTVLEHVKKLDDPEFKKVFEEHDKAQKHASSIADKMIQSTGDTVSTRSKTQTGKDQRSL